ncbi:MAG: lactose/L-arabinose transport system substrate-binding protein [Petroclostridium sp.]|jgi:lactose/L-arabinose transport system substrate-binding protein|uniref:ABC transporter substrate-binding protein n=1 Tax=Petroclostridium xylanilyticum TaxID=1792311 RepID=UPI000B99C4FA|nr:sugar ABC transporter substrate-binding protein [Petroclostridium xylanilyticum]MBZ4645971.1 hypothetical protein [Clostridia bacterium]MDK2809604.1 lactose/L-arabinose transport system substrate-binding protein [Petroclostridium sp.]
MKFKRLVAVLLSMIMLISLFGGCSSKKPDTVTNEQEQKTSDKAPDAVQKNEANKENDIKGEITIAAWNDQADSMEAEIEGFNKKYPNVKVTVQRVTGTYEKIIPPLTAGMGAPDIVQVQQRDYQNFLMKFPDQFVDLTDKLKAHEKEFAEAAWISVVKDNKVYGIPIDLGPVGVYYRKDFFEQAGIDAKSLTTWDKFIAAGKELQKKLPNVKMTTYDTTGPDLYTPWQILMNQLGGEFYDANGNIDFTHEPAFKAMELLKHMKDEGLVFSTPTWDDRVRAVANGNTATIIYPVWYAGTIRHQAADLKGKWGVIPLPAFVEGGPNQAASGGSVFGITTQSKNKEAAWAFVEYCLLTNEGQSVQMKYGLFPAWAPYYDTEDFKKDDEYFGFSIAQTFADLSTNIPPLHYGVYFLDFRKPLLDAFGAAISGEMSIEKAFKQAEEQSAKATGLKIAE